LKSVNNRYSYYRIYGYPLIRYLIIAGFVNKAKYYCRILAKTAIMPSVIAVSSNKRKGN